MGIIPIVLGLFFYILPVFETQLLDQRKAEVKAGVDIMIGVIASIEEEMKSGALTEEMGKKKIQTVFKNSRYNGTDYFFAYNSKGIVQAHGTRPEYIGTDRSDTKDPSGKLYVKEMLEYAGKDDGGFVTFAFDKVKGQALVDKISYAKYFAPLGWLVVSGVYLDDIQSQVSAIRMKVILGLIIVSLGAVILSGLYASRLCGLINKIASDLFSEADMVGEVAVNISKASQVLSSSTTQQAAALQETSSSIEETSAMITKNAENAKASMAVSIRSQASVEEGKKFVDGMIMSIQEIAESNANMVKQIDESNREIAQIVRVINEIGDKTKIINDIVFQTKLLSFNASVEAARAGEHGKGFAVVAEEIGNLAQMSGNSAKEIAELLGTSIQTVQLTINNSKVSIAKIVANGDDKIKQGSDVAKRCGVIFDQIVQNVNQVNQMVGEISVASDEQATGVKEITAAVAELDSVGQENTLMSQKTSEYAEQLRGQVEALRKNTHALDVMIKGKEQDQSA